MTLLFNPSVPDLPIVLQCGATLPEPLQDKRPQYCTNTAFTLIVVM